MEGILWRILLAVIVVVIIFALIPPLVALMGVSVDGNLLRVIRICVLGLAALYVLRGSTPWPRA